MMNEVTMKRPRKQTVYERISSLSEQLNEASDQVSKHLADLEAFLNSKCPGVECWHVMTGGDNDDSEQVLLGWCKIQPHGWRLCVKLRNAKNEDDEHIGVLTHSPRPIRILAYSNLTGFLLQMEKQIAAALETVQSVMTTAIVN
jgi:hypothetical protein